MTLGYAHRVNGNLAKAEDYALKAVSLFHRFSNQAGLAQATGNLGIVYFHQGNLTKAISHLDAALEIWLELKNTRKQIETLLEIVECELKKGDIAPTTARLKKLKQIIVQTPRSMWHLHLQQRLDAISSAVAVDLESISS